MEEEEINAQGPARMSAVDDGLTTFRNQSFLFGGWIWYGNEWKKATATTYLVLEQRLILWWTT